MGRKNQQGQILIEVIVVMLFVVTILFVGMSHLTTLKNENNKYQFTERGQRGVR